jgi:serine/threonine protein kinase
MTRILVAEDEPDIALGLGEDLRRNGYEIQTVGDGEDALRRAKGEAWDLILLDVMLPRLEGFEVCRQLRRSGVATPVILLTAKSHEAEKVLGLELGADDYVTKPFSPRELRARISALLRRSENKSALRYQILEELGAGGMGIIYKAIDRSLGRHVALKFLPENLALDDGALKRFKHEARIASSLNHPNICTIHDIDQHDGRPFIVMELLEGQPLNRKIAGKRLPIDELFAIAAQVLDGLQALHARGLIHRDIKSSNIFVGRDGRTKILDFGLATVAGGSNTSTIASLTAIGNFAGTIAYMSPEQALGLELDARSDLFSFGVTLYEMATGKLPFIESAWTATANAIIHKRAPAVGVANPAVSQKLAAVIEKLLEKDLSRRYQAAADVKADLTDGIRQ